MNTAFEATATYASSLVHGEGPRAVRLPGWTHWFLRTMAQVPPEAADRSTGLYNRAGLIRFANQVLRERAPHSEFSVVVLEFSDLREVCAIYGNSVASKVVTRLVRRLHAVAGWRGVVGRTGPAQFTVVLPGADEHKAHRRIQRGLGKPARIEFDAGDSEIVLVPDYLVDVGDPGTPVQDIYRDMCRELARRQKDERRRLHFMTSERERHSRPMSFPAP